MEGMDLKLFFNKIILNKIYIYCITILQKYLRKNGKILLNNEYNLLPYLYSLKLKLKT